MSKRVVLLAGATGLIGQVLLDRLLADASVQAVHVLARRSMARQHQKLTVHQVDFQVLPDLPSLLGGQVLDEVYLALGTTIRDAGSQAAFRAVDFQANLAVAQAALPVGAKRLGLVSAMGADPSSRVFYNRVKGELEQALAALPYRGMVFARPSLLLGDRTALGQQPRTGEELGRRVGHLLGALVPRHYRPVAAVDVARALLGRVPAAEGRQVVLSGQMQDL